MLNRRYFGAVKRSRKASFLRVTCHGCRAWLDVLTSPEESGLRLMEFARAHNDCYGVPVDENGMAMKGFGSEAGQYRHGHTTNED